MQKKLLSALILLLGAIFLDAQIFSWKNPNLPKDSLKKDSVIAARIQRDYFVRDTADFVRFQNRIQADEAVRPKNTKTQILGDLNAKGSLIRGVTMGNTSGTSAQSSMDLQITGKLSPDISVLASISDHNLPMQADGYTQTLQEFDKIYLQLNIKKNSILKAGHIDLADDQTFFGKYQRRTMGLQFLTGWETPKGRTDMNISAGIARSEFFRMRFQGMEGNQGPYRLLGKNGEQFITIISGSEQVYIDGILMKRGENQDYVINYNTGEITFTSFRPILRQNFITVSYNYTNQNYSRYLLTGGISHLSKKLRTGFSFFLENDNKNAPLSIDLSKNDKQILAAAGNNPELMYAPSGVQTAYDVNKILYRAVSSVAGNFYEFSTDKAETLYQVTFTYFGDGRGDYKILQTTNNGRVFQYVGKNLGDYAAVRRLPAPEKSQVFSGNAEYLLNGGKIGADFSLSNYDRNLYSTLDNDQNTGYAARIYGNKIFTKNLWKIIPEFEYQHISDKFHILDRINNVDFWRDFNLDSEFNQRTQDRLTAAVSSFYAKNFGLNYRFNYLTEKDYYKGIKNDLDLFYLKGKIAARSAVSYLHTTSVVEDTRFLRGTATADFLGKKGSWGIGASAEQNEKKYAATNLYDVTSYRWQEAFLRKKIGDSSRVKLSTKIYLRSNDSVRGGVMQRVNNILGIMAESQLIKTENTQLSALVHYRKFYFSKNLPQPSNNSDFVIGNLMYNQNLFHKGMRLQAFYELGNGQEAQREFQYIKVPDGQGVYRWTDYNGDGVQQLDEFEVAQYLDQAQYIRVYTDTVHYIASNKNKLQAALFVNPSVIFDSENKFLKRWNFNVSLLAQNSFLKGSRVLVWNPFQRENSQILKNQNILATAQFNKNEASGWNGSYRFLASDNLINANFSREERRQTSHTVIGGYWFSNTFRTDWENTLQDITNNSESFATRDYSLKNVESKPKATYKVSDALQAELFAAYRRKVRTDGEERLQAWEITGTLQWEKAKTSVRANISFINNNFTGNSFSLVGNQMLDGLKPGKNEVWTVYLQQKINSFLMLNLNYEGRFSGERTIHVGSVQMKAGF